MANFAALRRLITGSTALSTAETPEGEEEEVEGEEVETPEGEEEEEGGDPAPESDEEEEEGGDPAPAAADKEAAAERRGTMKERRRWAAVMTSKEYEGREEQATAMLAQDLGAKAIISILGDTPRAGGNRMRTVPRHDLGGNTPTNEGGKDGSAGEASRKRALEQQNARHGSKKTTTNGKARVGNTTKGD